MSNKSRNSLWILLAVALILGVLWQTVPLSDAKGRLAELPLSGLGYEGKDIPLKPFEEKFLRGVNVIKRQYDVDGREFFITVIDGTQNRHVVHDPYYCFTGSGWGIKSEKPIPIREGYANQIILEKNGRYREALYWFSNGNGQYFNPLKYWYQATLRRLTFGLLSSEPVLIVVQPMKGGKVDWNQFMKVFSPLFSI